MTNFFLSKFNSVSSLSLRLKKKNTSIFSKSQPLRGRLLTKNRNFKILGNPLAMLGIPGIVARIEHDPYRSSGVALIFFKNKTCSYYRNIHNLNIGDTILSSLKIFSISEYKRGNTSSLYILPTSLAINQVDIKVGTSAKYSTAAGTYSTLIRKNDVSKTSFVRLSSGIIKQLSIFSFATVGIIGNISHSKNRMYKAGQNRWLGKRPTVRGVAKNPVDHPHGGGEGKKSQNMFPKTFWGKKLKWRKTSRSKKNSISYNQS